MIRILFAALLLYPLAGCDVKDEETRAREYVLKVRSQCLDQARIAFPDNEKGVPPRTIESRLQFLDRCFDAWVNKDAPKFAK
jgi:hypothetical protein